MGSGIRSITEMLYTAEENPGRWSESGKINLLARPNRKSYVGEMLFSRMVSLTAKKDPLDLLKLFASGSLSVGVNGRPLLSMDVESRSVGIEVEGILETGLKLSKLATSNRRPSSAGLLKTSLTTAKGLSDIGWRFSINEKGSPVLAMGRGVSRLTGHVRANPLKLRRLAKIL